MSPAPMTKDGHATTTSWPAAAAASATSSPRRFVAMYGYWRARSGNGERSSSGRSGLSAMPTDATLETCTTRCTPAERAAASMFSTPPTLIASMCARSDSRCETTPARL